MIAETMAYIVLSQDAELNALFNDLRGGEFGNGFKQGIFTYDIPENPNNLKKADLAPFMRINTIYSGDYEYADDENIATEQRIVIDYWCQTASQSEQINKKIDVILKNNGFERYTANETPRYKDSAIDLLMNVRKYRFFDWDI